MIPNHRALLLSKIRVLWFRTETGHRTGPLALADYQSGAAAGKAVGGSSLLFRVFGACLVLLAGCTSQEPVSVQYSPVTEPSIIRPSRLSSTVQASRSRPRIQVTRKAVRRVVVGPRSEIARLIHKAANRFGVDGARMVRLGRCESGTGDVDWIGKLTIRPVDGSPTMYLFEDEILEAS